MATLGFTRRRPKDRREVSLNELEGLVRAAALGSGLVGGLADEAGQAVRWLNARGLPGAELIVDWLERRWSGVDAEMAPTGGRGVWFAHGARLCPLTTGAAIADRAATEVVLGPVAAPLLLAPFAALVAGARGVGLELAWDGGLVSLAVDAEGWRAEGPDLAAADVGGVSLHPASAAVQPGWTKPARPQLPIEVVERLEKLAAGGRVSVSRGSA